ncbi:MAG: spore coat U domain-containing protein [Hyphomonadaceae bacterium]
MRAPFAFALALSCATPAEALLCQPILGCTCDVSADDLNFGTFAPIDNQPRSADGDVDVHCTGLIELFPSILVRINGGTWGSVGDREMRRAGGSEEIDYNILTDGGAIWGDGTGGHPGQTLSGGALALGVWDVSATMNGEMPAAPTALPGSYSDTLTVRIDW